MYVQVQPPKPESPLPAASLISWSLASWLATRLSSYFRVNVHQALCLCHTVRSESD